MWVVDSSNIALEVNNLTDGNLFVFKGSNRWNSTQIKEDGTPVVKGDLVQTTVSDNIIIVLQRNSTKGATLDVSF